MEVKKIALIVGSLRKESYNLKMAKALIALQPASLALETVDISALTLYNDDLEQDTPEPWLKFRNQIRGFDGVIFLSPEYNRSMPAVLKNALDVGSRPYIQNVWANKPGAIISVTPGRLGAFGANHHLRQSLVALNVPTMQQPEAYISEASKLFDADGNLQDQRTIDFMNKFLSAFSDWANKIIA